MLAKRLLTIIVLLPVLVGLIAIGGWAYFLLITLALGIAAWEYWNIFTQGGFRPARQVLVGGVVLLLLGRAALDAEMQQMLLAGLTLVAMGVSVFHYEQGWERAASDFGVTMGGLVYLGWLGGFLISIRTLPDGLYWLMLVLPAVWLADGGAYLGGRRFGRHKMSQRVSPNKTWEGYAWGVAFSTLGCTLLALLWQPYAHTIQPIHGLLLGLVLSVVAPLGDLGE
ncbi:MAG: phosphatidate cytidylyltransferase, partial [Chloroflexi bacterium]|nr:phosphatidate cytidylyltransferase [Chloroflexota bacterium]